MAHRVLILGSTGMLGHMVERVLASDPAFAVRGVRRAELDVEGDFRVLDAILHDADFVINCIGVTARHIHDRDPVSVARSIRVNAEFTHALAAAAHERGIRVVHMSTDGVFSGRAATPYAEDTVPDAADTYGRSKLLGESAALNVLNVRCSIVGPSPVKREGLWAWVAAQPDGAVVDGYTNHRWHGATTLQFAELCRVLIVHERFAPLRVEGHVLHFAPNAPCSKAELIAAIGTAIGKRITVRPITHTMALQRILVTRPTLAWTPQSFPATLAACALAMT